MRRRAMATVGFVGTGLLGSAMVEGMVRRGDSVTVWNRTEAKARALEARGARVAASPGDAAAGVADVFAMAKGRGIGHADALAICTKFQAGGVIRSRGEKMARGDFSASFELTMARKGMRLMLDAAGHQPMTVLPAIAQRMDEAIAKGHGHEDLGVIAAEVIR